VQKTNLLWNEVRIGRSRSSKVNQKARMRLPISPS